MMRVDRLGVRGPAACPGCPRQTGQVCVFGSRAEHVRDTPQNILVCGGELDVHLEPDHRLVVGHGQLGPRDARAAPQVECQGGLAARARARNSVASSSAGAVSWRPTGKPGIVDPHGTLTAGMPARFARDREDVVQVHRQRVVGLRPDRERGRRRRRRHEHVEALERGLEVADDQRADLLRLCRSTPRSSRPTARRCRA